MLEAELLAAFEAARNERELQPFLKANSILVRNAFNQWAWNHVEALPEFRLGAEGQVDFLVLSAHSGNWCATFVELKSHRSKLFTKAGVPSKSLNEALQQLDDRGRWVENNGPTLRRALADYFAGSEVPAYCSHASSHQLAETEIIDPRTHIQFKYVAVLGRRSSLSVEDQERRARLRGRSGAVATYDRLVDVAKKIDQAERELNERATDT